MIKINSLQNSLPDLKVLSIYRYYTRLNSIKLKRFVDIPGPRSIPFIGNLFAYKEFGGHLTGKEFDKFVIELNRNYGDLVKWSLFGQNSVFIFKSEYAKLIYQSEGSHPSRSQVIPWVLYSKSRNIPFGLINSQGNLWKKQRSASNPIVGKPNSVKMLLNTHNTIINEFMTNLKTNIDNQNEFIINKFDILLKLLTIEMMSSVAFDHRLNSTNDKESVLKLFKLVEIYGEITGDLYYSFPIWRIFRTKKFKEFEKVSDELFEFFARKYIHKAHEKMNHSLTHSPSMLQRFLKDSSLSFDEIVSISKISSPSFFKSEIFINLYKVFEFMLGSYDTITNTLHFLLYNIATNQNIQEEIFKEILEICPNRFDIENITEENLARIPLIKATLKESQRLNGLAPIIGRNLDHDIIIDQYLIPKNTTVNIGLSVMSRSEKYFKNPNEFNPKRWLKNQQLLSCAEPIDPFCFLPFGFGARMCIGRRLAEQKIYLILIKLLKNYKIEYVGKEMKAKFRLVFAPNQPLDLKLIKRNQN